MLQKILKLPSLRNKILNYYCHSGSYLEHQIDEDESIKVRQISQVMKTFYKKSLERENTMQVKRKEFEVGKRHLANMMGLDPLTLNQSAINEAISYLFPSGLYSKKARPFMKPPEEIYPKQKDLQFDKHGKPFNSFFYTAKGNFYSLLYDIADKLEEMDEEYNNLLRKHLGTNTQPTMEKMDVTGHKIFSKEVLEQKLLEKLSDWQYKTFVANLQRLIDHPLSDRVKDFVLTNVEKIDKINLAMQIPPVIKDENGVIYSEAYGKSKTFWAHAKLIKRSSVIPIHDNNDNIGIEKNHNDIDHDNNSNKNVPMITKYQQPPYIIINGDRDITYFETLYHRGHLLLPLTFWGATKFMDEFIVELHLQERPPVNALPDIPGYGTTCKAKAGRLAIARALTAFLEPAKIEMMRLAGLLTYDLRTRERKKPGQKGARAKFRWRKR